MTRGDALSQPWRTDAWWVSHFNYADEIRKAYALPTAVEIHDVTLRDGEQQAGIVFTKEDKVRMARLLDEARVDRIEAGMPAVSGEDRKAIKEIAHIGLQSEVYCLCRCMKPDVDLALQCDVDGIEIELPSSQHLIEQAYNWPLEKALALPAEATRYAAEHGLKVSFFTVDGTRADMGWWFKVIDKVASEGHMDALAVVDTFGVCTPDAIGYYVKRVKQRLRDTPVEIHCHNTFGLAVANTLAAVAAGAEVVHATVNGIGEGSGNADLAPTALALKALYGVNVKMDLAKLSPLARAVEELTKIKMPPNYPIVGDEAFAVESGLLVSWWLQTMRVDPKIVFPYDWKLVGRRPPEIFFGKKSGMANVQYALGELGLTLPEEKAGDLLLAIKEESILKRRRLTLEEVRDLCERQMGGP